MRQNKKIYKNSIKSYYKNNIRYILLQKYGIEEVDNFEIKKIELTYAITTITEEDGSLMNSLVFLETITGNKSIGYGVYKYIGSSKKFFFNGLVTLHKENVYEFFNYLSAYCLPKYIKRNGVLKEVKTKTPVILKLNDLNIFYNFNVFNLKGGLNILLYGGNGSNGSGIKDFLELIKIKI